MLVETHEDGGRTDGAGGYEAAPATELVATRCVACGRKLLDAQSLATAMGKDCREKYGVAETLTEEQRAAANGAIYRLALPDHGGAAAPELLTRLQDLGFTLLVARIATRSVKVRTQWSAERRLLLVKTPKNEGFDRVAPRLGVLTPEGLTVATNELALRLVYEAIAQHFGGLLSWSPRGFAIVPALVSGKSVRL